MKAWREEAGGGRRGAGEAEAEAEEAEAEEVKADEAETESEQGGDRHADVAMVCSRE
jgi:hypothetical protein